MAVGVSLLHVADLCSAVGFLKCLWWQVLCYRGQKKDYEGHGKPITPDQSGGRGRRVLAPETQRVHSVSFPTDREHVDALFVFLRVPLCLIECNHICLVLDLTLLWL